MQVAVIGAGAIGLGSAALLQSRSHAPMLWSPALASQAGAAILVSQGAIEGSFNVVVAGNLADAVRGADAVLVCLPGWAHQAVFDAIASLANAGQTVIISSHSSLGGLYLRRRLLARGVDAPVVGWGTTIVTGRRTAPLACTLSNVRSQVDAAALPDDAGTAGLALCASLFGDRFMPRAGLLAIQLSNVNPQNHLAMLLCNITRVERGEDWGNYWGITGSVARLMEALDRERLAVAARFGVQVRTVHEHFHLSFAVPLSSLAEMAAAVDARGNTPLGPKSLDTRYALEDVPYGIVVTEALARIAGVQAPLHTAGIEMLCALYDQDFRAANELLAALGLDGTDAAGLQAAVRGTTVQEMPASAPL